MSPVKYFLDTHILVWWFEASEKLNRKQRQILDEYERHKPFGVSDVTLAELGCLVAAGRLQLSRDLKDWLSRAMAEPLVKLHRITPAVVAEISSLPVNFPKDPADRMIVATARLENATLLTCDQRIIDSGAVPTC